MFNSKVILLYQILPFGHIPFTWADEPLLGYIVHRPVALVEVHRGVEVRADVRGQGYDLALVPDVEREAAFASVRICIKSIGSIKMDLF